MHRLKTKLSFFLFYLLLILNLSIKAQDNNLDKQIKEIEGRLTAIIESNNIEALDSLLHPEFTVQSTEGDIVKKAELLSGFRSGHNPYIKFKPSARSVVFVNEITVISSGEEIYSHKGEDEKGKDHTRFYYHVWIKMNNSWRLAARFIAPLTVIK